MPALFIGHGSPMNALEDNSYTRAWRALGTSLPRPTAIVSVSAHWYTRGTGVTAMATPRLIYDFSGFPQPLYEQQYPAPGDPALAARVQSLLVPTSVTLDQSWGLDHGTWSVLVHLYPNADIPVVQLSIDSTQPAQFHYELGQKLAALRAEGVLILGSGNVVHNLRTAKWGDAAAPYPWAIEFNDRLRASLASGDHSLALDPAMVGQSAALSIPTPEHYLPLLYVLGAATPGERTSFPVEGLDLGSISMLAVQVG
jgi:4,5-DOPA dioxygenase extradiol